MNCETVIITLIVVGVNCAIREICKTISDIQSNKLKIICCEELERRIQALEEIK